MKNFIARRQQAEIERLLANESAVLLLGQCQAGKTTLAGKIIEAQDGFALNFRERDVARRVRQQGLKQCIKDHGKHLTVLDEVQVRPGLFADLLPIIDARRWEDTDIGSFLLLGSASEALANKSDESLLGRIHYVYLDPLDVLEIDSSEVGRLWLRGGLPRSFTASSDAQSFERRQNIIDYLIKQELWEHKVREARDKIEDMLEQLAYQHGGMLNKSSIVKEVELVSERSVEKLIKVLCGLLVIRQLPAYDRAQVQNHQKTPRIYYRDSGLLHQLLNLHSVEQLEQSPMADKSWKGFAIENILRLAGPRVRASYYRTSSGCSEMDLVLRYPGGAVWAIEIKKGNPGASASFSNACRSIQPDRCFVAHDRLDIARHEDGQGVEKIPLPDMCREVAAELRKSTGSSAGSAQPSSKPE